MGEVKKISNQNNRSIHRDQLITLSDLDEFKDDLLVRIKHILFESKSQTIKYWLKSYQVKKLLNISTGTLQNLRHNGTIPFTLLGGTIYYDPEDIERELQKRKKQFGKTSFCIKNFKS